MVLREKAVETCEKASIFKGFRAFLATPKPWVVGSSPSAPAKERGIGRASGLFLFLLLWVGGLEGETVQSGLPVDVRDRGRPSAQFARESSPSAPAKTEAMWLRFFFFSGVFACFSVQIGILIEFFTAVIVYTKAF